MKKYTHRFFFLVILSFITLFFYLTLSKDLPLFPPKGESVFVSICNDSVSSKYDLDFKSDLPVIYFVTPTYTRREQFAELTRLSQTLAHVKNLIWIVAEDSNVCSNRIRSILERQRFPSVHLVSPMPKMYEKAFYKPRGVSSRNAALDWISSHIQKQRGLQKWQPGVVYFGDDDNTYDLRLFDEIRWTKKVSMFPVGMIVDQGLSSPIVKDGKVVGFTDPWLANRKFPVDMAGFAFNTVMLQDKPSSRMPYKAGHEEDLFLKTLNVELEDIEPKAKDCTEVLVWHTQTVKGKKAKVRLAKNKKNHGKTSLDELMKDLGFQGIVEVSPKGKEITVCYQESCS